MPGAAGTGCGECLLRSEQRNSVHAPRGPLGRPEYDDERRGHGQAPVPGEYRSEDRDAEHVTVQFIGTRPAADSR